MSKIIKLTVICLCVALAGCDSDSKRVVDLNLKYVTAKNAPVQAPDRNAQASLAESATSVSHSLQQLSAMQMALHPKAKIGAPLNPKAIGMAQIASLNWDGPVEPVLKRIASATGYRVVVLGQRPAVPVIVSVHARNQTLAAILRNVKYQANPKARVVIYPSRRVIELRYREYTDYNNSDGSVGTK
jgi:defect in organelle trafficking protein DotD